MNAAAGTPWRRRGASKRRAHKKSRNGCANCKLRAIKCDEARPSCVKCRSFHVRCVYGSKLSSDTLLDDTSFQVDIVMPVIQSPSAPLPVVISYDDSESYQLAAGDMPLIEKFQLRTIVTMGSSFSRQSYVDGTLPIAFSSPLVMHMVLALTEIHDETFSTDGERASENHHWNCAIALLRKRLSKPIVSSDRDALWLAVALQSIAYLAASAATSPADAWPLRSPSPLDLAWMKLCDGKRLITDLTKPTRRDSAFHLAATELQAIMDSMRQTVSRDLCMEYLPSGFYEIFELSKGSGNNIYHAALAVLAQILSQELDENNFLPHLCWLCVLDQRFKDLLHQKDERAMLLLLYWYAKICDRRLWWMWRQTWTEGLAICSYLETAWREQSQMVELLVWPRTKLTLASMDVRQL
ncbi:hypothetical protein BX600DRAFT_32219 [Xylariales sp. PMI_506]|nr:hypothetical protein BX600DRAFT_32219 [Xylariales sp. PMI_506]